MTTPPDRIDRMAAAKEIAKAHVDWFLKTIRPLLIEHFEHGFKHGLEEGQGTRERITVAWDERWEKPCPWGEKIFPKEESKGGEKDGS